MALEQICHTDDLYLGSRNVFGYTIFECSSPLWFYIRLCICLVITKLWFCIFDKPERCSALGCWQNIRPHDRKLTSDVDNYASLGVSQCTRTCMRLSKIVCTTSTNRLRRWTTVKQSFISEGGGIISHTHIMIHWTYFIKRNALILRHYGRKLSY